MSSKIHTMFVNTLRTTAPNFIYDIETLIVYMMDAAPTHLADLMTNEFTQGYLAGFVVSMVDYAQAEYEYEQQRLAEEDGEAHD